MKSTSFFSLLFFITVYTVLGQASNGEVSSLVAAENYLAGIAKEKGIKKAFLAVSDDETIVFRPGPVKAVDYFEKQKVDNGELSWQPVLAKISRSGDWGFTTGPFEYNAEGKITYGDYVSVWKLNGKGVWKLALDLGVSHPKPLKEPELVFTNPKNARFYNQRSQARLKQREDIILTSDKLFSKTLDKYNNLAYNVFLGENARLLFPGYEPVIGKTNVTDFLRLQELQVKTEAIAADRALGSDLAYTYGTASITNKGSLSKYNYVRIWEVQDGRKWNVILEIYKPVGN